MLSLDIPPETNVLILRAVKYASAQLFSFNVTDGTPQGHLIGELGWPSSGDYVSLWSTDNNARVHETTGDVLLRLLKNPSGDYIQGDLILRNANASKTMRIWGWVIYMTA